MSRTRLVAMILGTVLCACGADETTPTDTIQGPDTTSSADGQTTGPDAAEHTDVASAEDTTPEPDSPCVSACDGKACGDDGCGGSCGGCEDGLACDDVGQCAFSLLATR